MKIFSALVGLTVLGAVHAQDGQQGLAMDLFLKASSHVVDDAALRDMRGGTDTQTNDIWSNGTVGQNQASYLTTGSNFVDGGSFTNATGFPTVVQNSGNNVLIQNSTIINLQLQ
jgi:hypothetical protein